MKNHDFTSNKEAPKTHEITAVNGHAISINENKIVFIKNIIDYCEGKKSHDETIISLVGNTTSPTALKYSKALDVYQIKNVTAISKSSVKDTIGKIAKPLKIVINIAEITKIIYDYFSGEIDGAECLEKLGRKGYCVLNTSIYAALGQAAIPIPFLGGFIGSIFGYILSSSSYNILLQSLQEAKIARSERIRIERESAKAVAMLREYRAYLEQLIEQYLSDQKAIFNSIFDDIKNTLSIGDIDGYIYATNKITETMGKSPLYRDIGEFEKIMTQKGIIKI